MKLTNNSGISLPMAVWLATDEYDYDPDPRTISATSLMKPVRQILLKERLTAETRRQPDVSDFIASRSGTAIHDSLEKAWTENYAKAMRLLGHPEDIIERVAINPTDLAPGDNYTIPVYLEQRGKRDFRGYRISGKFDLCINGELNDIKTTSTYAWKTGNKDEDYKMQGSIYKWIHRDKITSDHINIQFWFTDWQKGKVKTEEGYPPSRLMERRVELMSIKETEIWLNQKFDELEKHADLTETQLPHCTDEELWRSETVYKYFSNPAKTSGRATRRFTDLAEAQAHKAEKGKGVILTFPGQVKACSYCPVFGICSQKDQYEHG